MFQTLDRNIMIPSFPQTVTNNQAKLKDFILRDDDESSDQILYNNNNSNKHSCHESVLRKSPSFFTKKEDQNLIRFETE